MGLACVPIGALVGTWAAVSAIGSGYAAFALCAPVASFISGSLAWWLLVARSCSHSRARGALAGGVAAIVGHYICWYLVLVANFVSQSARSTTLSPGQQVPNPLEAIAWAGRLRRPAAQLSRYAMGDQQWLLGQRN